MGRKEVKPDNKYGNASELLEWSKHLKSSLETRRYLAIRLLLLDRSREEVEKALGVSKSCLRKWVSLWNKGGREYLKAGLPSGRKSRMTEEAKNYVSQKIEFTNTKTGERMTGIAISGILKKKVLDKIMRRSGLLSFTEDGL